MKKLKSAFSLLLCMIMVFGAVAVGGEGIELPSISDIFGAKATAATSGTCGDNLTWSFDESTGTLEISGTGDMTNYSWANRPWEDSEDLITTVTIGNGVTSIGDNAFYDFDILAKVSIPYGVTKIGTSAFEYCSNIQSIIIPDGVVSIGRSAFYSCAGLTSLTIPDSVTSIGNRAFSGCTGLTSLTIPDSVTSIGDSAFSSCTGLTSLTIPNSVTTIGDSAFSGCTGLTSVTIPDSVTELGSGAFVYCDNLATIDVVSSNSDYSSADGVLFDKSKTRLIQYPVGKKSTAYSIPAGITSIEFGAFADCTTLTSIIIPDSVTSIGYSAFGRCTGLTSITIPDSVTSIGVYAFEGCTGLTSVTIPDSVTSIGYSAFGRCTGLTSITIPDSVTSIDGYAFVGCTGLTSVTIPDSITSIGYSAFGRCTGLTSITIPDSVTSIDGYAFEDCTGLTSVTIPDSVTSIGSSAFKGCTGLTSATIPDGVTSIGNHAFERCTGLTSVTIPDSVTSIGDSAFKNCKSLESVKIPEKITEIEYCTFSGCSSLKTVDISSSVVKIGGSAFEACESLTNFGVPSGVTNIDDTAFVGCSKLNSIEVSPENTTYSSENGVLFSKDKTKLILYPYAKTDSTYCIPDSVTELDSSFYYNTALVEINSDSASETYSSADGVLFNKNKTELIRYPVGKSGTKYAIPSSVTKIGALAFYNCNNLVDVKLPQSINKIESYAFNRCKKLTSIIIPTGVTEISEACFACCENLVSITIPERVTSIGSLAFVCTKLASIVIPDSVTTIGEYAFGGCSELESINIPKGVSQIGQTVFFGCDSLKKIEVDPQNEKYSSDEQGVLYNKDKTVLIRLPQALSVYYMPDTVKEIVHEFSGDMGSSAISFCSGVERFIVGDGNEVFSSDAQGALYNKDKTSLIQYPCANPSETFILPSTVIDLWGEGIMGFSLCQNLKRIEVEAGNKIFQSDENGILYATDGKDRTLIKIPDKTSLEFFCVPENVTLIFGYALANTGSIKRIHCPENLLEYAVEGFGSYYTLCFAIKSFSDPFEQLHSESYVNESLTPTEETRILCSEGAFPYPEYLPYLPAYGVSFELCDGNHDVHKHTPKTVTVPASCTVDGMEYEVCSECGETIGTPTVIKAKGHTEVKDIAVKPTCTATGLTEGAHCSVCNTIIKKQEVIPATGHTEVKDIAVKPTCTATGLTEGAHCSVCNTIIKKQEVIPATGHTEVKDIAVKPTCTATGLSEGAHCSVCNTIIKKQEVIPATGHTSGDWIVVTEPTADTDGKRVKKCTVCGTILSEEILPKLTVAVDEKTGIELDYSGGDYSGKVELSVEETFDGAAFNLVNTQFNVSQSFIYDIKMTVDGVETQPTGTVKVRIPLPEGFDPARTFVYHVDTETGKVVKMAAIYKDGYLEFETDHFSYYAVVEEAKPCKLSINTPSVTTVSYGFTLNLHANVTDLPEGARVVWSMDGSGFELIPSADGMTCGVKSVSKGSATITAKVVDKNGNAVKDANGNEITASQQLTSKAGFFQKLVAFFKKLFGSNMVIPSSLNKLVK